MPTLKNVKIQKISAKQRREEIKELTQEIGFFNLDKKGLAKRYKVHIVQIYKDLKILAKSLDFKDVNTLKFILGSALIQALKKSQQILSNSKNPNITLKAANTVAKICEMIIKFAESFGIKNKIEEDIKDSKPNLFEEIAKILEEEKKETEGKITEN